MKLKEELLEIYQLLLYVSYHQKLISSYTTLSACGLAVLFRKQTEKPPQTLHIFCYTKSYKQKSRVNKSLEFESRQTKATKQEVGW